MSKCSNVTFYHRLPVYSSSTCSSTSSISSSTCAFLVYLSPCLPTTAFLLISFSTVAAIFSSTSPLLYLFSTSSTSLSTYLLLPPPTCLSRPPAFLLPLPFCIPLLPFPVFQPSLTFPPSLAFIPLPTCLLFPVITHL